jgi:dolichol kinase
MSTKNIAIPRMLLHMTSGFLALLAGQILSISTATRDIIVYGMVVFSYAGETVLLMCERSAYASPARWSRFYPMHQLMLQKGFFRDYEVGQYKAVASFATGLLLCYVLFPLDIAVWSVIVLGFGDPSARLFGVTFGKRKIYKQKTLPGFLGFVGVGVIIVSISLIINEVAPLTHRPINFVLWLTLCAGVGVAALTELRFERWDNACIPVAMGGFLCIVL